jgi:hypothetical protein
VRAYGPEFRTSTALNRKGVTESTFTSTTRSPAFFASWSIFDFFSPTQKCHRVGVVAFRSGSWTAAVGVAFDAPTVARTTASATSAATVAFCTRPAGVPVCIVSSFASGGAAGTASDLGLDARGIDRLPGESTSAERGDKGLRRSR